MSRLIEQMEPEDPPSTGDLDFEPASFSKSLPSFAIPADRFATVFSECVASGGSRSACDVNVSQLIKDIASGKKTGQPLNVPVVCDSCGSGSQMAPPDVSSHPDVLSMLRNVLDRLSTIDTRLERVEKIVNAEFFSKGC